MSRQTKDTASILEELQDLLTNFREKLSEGADLRTKVLALVPAFHDMMALGPSLIPSDTPEAARDRILMYFKAYPLTVISSNEIMVVAGISEWARRLRELRVQFGWKILSGTTVKEMLRDGSLEETGQESNLRKMKTDDYILISLVQDIQASYRWNVANTIRRADKSVRDKILQYLLENIRQPVTGDELRYVANNRTEWARRVRELRTELGWPIFTKQLGRPDLNVGEYVLMSDHQSDVHDRNISDDVRRAVLMRDQNTCVDCGWNQREWNTADPRFLELHHRVEHVDGGDNTVDNLITLCNICHDRRHKH